MTELTALLLYGRDVVWSTLTHIVPAWWLCESGWRKRLAVSVWATGYHLSEARIMGRRRFYRCCAQREWPDVWPTEWMGR